MRESVEEAGWRTEMCEREIKAEMEKESGKERDV